MTEVFSCAVPLLLFPEKSETVALGALLSMGQYEAIPPPIIRLLNPPEGGVSVWPLRLPRDTVPLGKAAEPGLKFPPTDIFPEGAMKAPPAGAKSPAMEKVPLPPVNVPPV